MVEWRFYEWSVAVPPLTLVGLPDVMPWEFLEVVGMDMTRGAGSGELSGGANGGLRLVKMGIDKRVRIPVLVVAPAVLSKGKELKVLS